MPVGNTKTTAEAFQYFIDEIYPSIQPKENALRIIVSRFKNNKYVSEERMIGVLQEYFSPVAYKQVPISWVVK